MCKVLKGYVELQLSKVLLECKDLLVQLVNKANVVRHYGTQRLVGDKGDRGERGEHGVKGEKGIQGDNCVLANHLPIQLATRYGEKCVCQVPCIRTG